MDAVLNIIVSGLAFLAGAYLLSGVKIESFIQAICVGVVVAVLDFTLGNFLRIVTLGILSLSIFTWLLNAILILVADWFLPKFKVENFWWALALAAVVSIVGSVLGKFVL